MEYFKKLVGEKVYLSPRSIEDAEKYAEWLNDFQVTDYTGKTTTTITVPGEVEYLKNNINNTASFGIVTLGSDKLIGSTSLEHFEPENRSACFGIFIGDEEYRNKGYGTEATRLILDFGFNYLNIHSIWLNVIECNERAIKCYQKCGFNECGRRRDAKFVNGKYYDLLIMEILEDNFNDSFIRNKNI